MASGNWKLSPSDFAFSWQECQRCYYLKVVRAFPRPRGIMPKIFGVIDNAMKAAYAGVRTEAIAGGMPPGVVAFGERWVKSASIPITGSSSTCFILGKFDTVLLLDDASFCVTDYKTSAAKPEHVALYSRQLHAYAWALEHPAPGEFSLKPVSKLGLLTFEPAAMTTSAPPTVALSGALSWQEIRRDDAAFLDFIGEVVSVLDQPEPPAPSPACEWCRYRDASRRTGF